MPTTNPAKTIFGAAYDVEFGNIAAAILSKYDSTTAAPSLLSLTVGTPTGGNLGAGSINAQSISVNNIAVALAGSVVTSFTSNTGLSINAAATGAITVTNTGVLSITGTASQITTSAATGAVTLSLPSAVTIAGLFSASSISLSAGGSVAAPQVFIEGAYGFGVDATGNVFFKNANNGNYYFTNSVGAATFNVNQGNVSIPAPSSGVALLITGVAGSSALQVLGTGVQVGSPTGGDQGLGTLNAVNLFVQGVAVTTGITVSTGSFTAGTTGLGGATSVCKWTKIGTSVTMFMAVPSAIVSTTTGFTLTGLPAAIQPTTSKYAAVPGLGLNNSALTSGVCALVSGSVITFSITGLATAWTASGNKTVGDGATGATFVWDTN